MGSLEISVIGLAPPCGRIQGVEKGAEFSCIKFVEPAVATCLYVCVYVCICMYVCMCVYIYPFLLC